MMYNKIKAAAEKVYSQLDSFENECFDGVSLHFGKSGLLLFYTHWLKLFNDSDTKVKVDFLFDEITNELFSNEQTPNFSHGVYGVIWGLKYCNRTLNYQYFDEQELDSLSEDLYDSVTGFLENEGDNDFMHGVIGGILTLDKNRIHKNADYLIKLIIDSSEYKSTGEYLWLDFFENETSNYNLGLAHGQLSFWYFISYIARVNKNYRKIALEIITSSYRSFQKFSIAGSYSSYGLIKNNSIDQQSNTAKLGWCYGDLSIANTLILIGKELKSTDLYQSGVELASKTLSRNTFESSGLFDLCMCHGASSCITIYQNIFQLTGLDEFKKASDNWTKNSLEFFNKDKIHFYETTGKRKQSNFYPSLLNGYVGFGLSLLGKLDRNIDWSECLILK